MSCWGEGLSPVPVRKAVSFYITAPQAKTKDICARVTGKFVNVLSSQCILDTVSVAYCMRSVGSRLVVVLKSYKLLTTAVVSSGIDLIRKVGGRGMVRAGVS